MTTEINLLEQKARAAKRASRTLAVLGTRVRNECLLAMARALREKASQVLEANQEDLAAAAERGLPKAMLKRLELDEAKIAAMAEGLEAVYKLPDPIGETVAAWKRPNGLEISQVRVPLGVVGIIYESRPNVTTDATGLCLKTGNAVLLRGGSEALHSNRALVEVIAPAAYEVGIPEGSIQLIETTDREVARRMMQLNQYIDVLIPRGGAGLIETVVKTATVPVIETGVGNCHVYIDEGADLEKAVAIAVNAKVSNPSVCNAMETLLVHEEEAPEFLPRVAEALEKEGVELRGCPKTRAMLPGIREATEEDWTAEYLDLVLAVKVVTGLEEAVDHINRYGTRHSEAIITENYSRARRFLSAVDAAAVYVNTSTRFTDGFEFGFGAEIGISTQKLHARGPMGLKELTTTKYVVLGDGQVRG